MPRANSSYRAARDLLQEMRTDRTSAVERFRWPDVGDSFNWAVDWFDEMARGNDRVALRVVAGDGSERSATFDEMATRSDRVATWLVDRGVRKGDHVMLMLGNRVELWETMLAIMKAGAVILPTSTVLGSADLADRVEQAGVRVVIADVAHTDVLDEVPGGFLRIAIGATDDAPAAAG
jgi:acetyl-CoA synthetase